MPAPTLRSIRALLAMLLLVMVVISVLGVALKNSVDDGNRKAAKRDVATLRRSAETRFILCTRNSTVTKPETAADLAIACDGFDTLAHAYMTLDVTPPPRSPT